MIKKVMALTEKEYNGKTILFPTETDIETNDICVMSNSSHTVGAGGKLLRLTASSFKDLKRDLAKIKVLERITML